MNTMNKALLIEAIMSSDMKSTTKSFLVSVLKSPAGEDSTAVSTTVAPRPRLALDGELSPGVEDEILAKQYPDHPDSVLWRKQHKPDFYDIHEDPRARRNTMTGPEYREFMANQPEGADLFDRTQNLGPAFERFINRRLNG